MKGFIKNEGNNSIFSFQRFTIPGNSIDLEDLYKLVGEKSGEKRGPGFVKWLRDTYLLKRDWAIYKEEGVPYFSGGDTPSKAAIEAARSQARGSGKKMKRNSDSIDKENEEVRSIVDNPIEISKPIIDRCNNKSTLRKALAATKIISKKEAHMRYLIKRLEQVY